MVNPSPHLLLAITADGDAFQLVERACQLSHASACTWSVVAIETPGLSQRSPVHRGSLLQALDLAQRLGATVTRISTGSDASSAVVSSLVHRAVSEGATTLMLGHHPGAGSKWPRSDQSLSEFTEALSQLLPGVTVHLVCVARADGGQPTQALRVQQGWYRPSLHAAPRVLAALLACTVAGAALERYLDPANVVMLYLAGVVYVASKAGRTPAIATVLGSIFLYDLIFVHPRWSLKPTEPQYWLAFLVMMVVGLIISQLAARSREQAMLAEARAQRTQALNQLSSSLGRAREPVAVAQALCAAVQSATGAGSTLLFVNEAGTDLLPDQHLPPECVLEWAHKALAAKCEVGAGMAAGTEESLRYIPLVVGDSVFGLLVQKPPTADRDSLEDQHLVRALVNQAAIALERAALERRSIAAAVEAEGERTRNTLLAGISHDFRTPLTTIMGSATTLIEQAAALDESRRRALLHTLLSESQRLHVLTSNLLDLTRLDEGAIQVRPEWCPADELLESARLQLGPTMRGVDLAVTVLPDALVWCDPRLMDQVLVNLLDNAVRHSPPGGWIRVSIDVTIDQWTLSVHDQGPGIPAGQEQAIFRKFYRAAGGSDSMGKGLGLAICAAIASLHGGSIHAENDEGARFVLRLPQPALPELELDEAT